MESAAIAAVADLLARGLAGDEVDYQSVMVEAEAMLRALCVHPRSRDCRTCPSCSLARKVRSTCASRRGATAASPRSCVLLLERWWTRVASSA